MFQLAEFLMYPGSASGKVEVDEILKQFSSRYGRQALSAHNGQAHKDLCC